jgi:hypothetical protein
MKSLMERDQVISLLMEVTALPESLAQMSWEYYNYVGQRLVFTVPVNSQKISPYPATNVFYWELGMKKPVKLFTHFQQILSMSLIDLPGAKKILIKDYVRGTVDQPSTIKLSDMSDMTILSTYGSPRTAVGDGLIWPGKYGEEVQVYSVIRKSSISLKLGDPFVLSGTIERFGKSLYYKSESKNELRAIVVDFAGGVVEDIKVFDLPEDLANVLLAACVDGVYFAGTDKSRKIYFYKFSDSTIYAIPWPQCMEEEDKNLGLYKFSALCGDLYVRLSKTLYRWNRKEHSWSKDPAAWRRASCQFCF